MSVKKVTTIAGVATAGVAAAALRLAAMRWDAATRDVRRRLADARVGISPAHVDFGELDSLPAPVQRYFRTVLRDGQPMISAVRVRHEGTFNVGEAANHWKPFTSDQQVVTHRPGFDWDARVRVAPGLSVRVRDAYVSGEGILRAAPLGLFAVVDMRGGGEIARGEAMRYLAEGAWYPTALLPSQGVSWSPVDSSSARATLHDEELSATLVFSFDERGTIAVVQAESRGRTVGGHVIPTPWEGRHWNYVERDGMLVPIESEVAWMPEDGERPYWRGKIRSLAYEFVASAPLRRSPVSSDLSRFSVLAFDVRRSTFDVSAAAAHYNRARSTSPKE